MTRTGGKCPPGGSRNRVSTQSGHQAQTLARPRLVSSMCSWPAVAYIRAARVDCRSSSYLGPVWHTGSCRVSRVYGRARSLSRAILPLYELICRCRPSLRPGDFVRVLACCMHIVSIQKKVSWRVRCTCARKCHRFSRTTNGLPPTRMVLSSESSPHT